MPSTLGSSIFSAVYGPFIDIANHLLLIHHDILLFEPRQDFGSFPTLPVRQWLLAYCDWWEAEHQSAIWLLVLFLCVFAVIFQFDTSRWMRSFENGIRRTMAKRIRARWQGEVQGPPPTWCGHGTEWLECATRNCIILPKTARPHVLRFLSFTL